MAPSTPARPRPEYGDNSNTQYALLGLRAARRAGAKVRREVWLAALDHQERTQLQNGSFAYTPERFDRDDDLTRRRNLSMTVAGISSVAICLEGLLGERAATALLRRQRGDGAWDGEADGIGGYGANLDTAWAILFLRRATTPLRPGQGRRGIEIERLPSGRWLD